MKPILKISLLLYVALLLAPGALRSAHIFADHQHVFCDHSSEQHIHKTNTDCDVFNFHQHSYPGLELFFYEFIVPEVHSSTSGYAAGFIFDQYFSNISLRGPPRLS